MKCGNFAIFVLEAEVMNWAFERLLDQHVFLLPATITLDLYEWLNVSNHWEIFYPQWHKHWRKPAVANIRECLLVENVVVVLLCFDFCGLYMSCHNLTVWKPGGWHVTCFSVIPAWYVWCFIPSSPGRRVEFVVAMVILLSDLWRRTNYQDTPLQRSCATAGRQRLRGKWERDSELHCQAMSKWVFHLRREFLESNISHTMAIVSMCLKVSLPFCATFPMCFFFFKSTQYVFSCKIKFHTSELTPQLFV